MNLATMRTRVRNGIKDIDAAAYYFVDAEIDAAITRALNDYCARAGQAGTHLINGTGSARVFALSAPADYLYTVAVEYPLDEDPPALIPYQEAPSGTIRLLGTIPVAGASNVRVWYAKLILTADAIWAMPASEEDVIEIGTSYYLTLAGARFAATRLNSSQAVPAALAKLAEHLSRDYNRRLDKVNQRAEYPTRFPNWPDA